MVCTEVLNQIKFVSHPNPPGSRTDFIYSIQTLVLNTVLLAMTTGMQIYFATVT
jgi:hypothetical protein